MVILLGLISFFLLFCFLFTLILGNKFAIENDLLRKKLINANRKIDKLNLELQEEKFKNNSNKY